jgi:hypothetical protein
MISQKRINIMKHEIKVHDKNLKLTNVMVFDTEKECEDWFKDYSKRKNIVDHTYAITDVTMRETIKEKIEPAIFLGKQRKACCEDILNFVTGYNIERKLTTEQVNTMQEQFGDALMALASNRVDIAKVLIQNGTPDGVITTEELKEGCLQIFEQYGV